MKVEQKALLLGSSMVLATALAAACVDHVDAEIKSCPCASGYVCCESGVCAVDSFQCDAATSALSASVEGTWSGYIENFERRPDAPDALRIMLTVAADGTLSSQVTFGGSAPPSPTDRAQLWPPNYDFFLDPNFLPGTSYRARDIKWQSRRLKFSVDLYEGWQPWCALQQSYPVPGDDGSTPAGVTPGDRYWCNEAMLADNNPDEAGHCAIQLSPGVTQPIDCGKYFMCSMTCQCEAGGCHAKPELTNAFDIAFDGATAEGSISFGMNYNVRLTRESH
jgi:hypothetical protein